MKNKKDFNEWEQCDICGAYIPCDCNDKYVTLTAKDFYPQSDKRSQTL